MGEKIPGSRKPETALEVQRGTLGPESKALSGSGKVRKGLEVVDAGGIEPASTSLCWWAISAIRGRQVGERDLVMQARQITGERLAQGSVALCFRATKTSIGAPGSETLARGHPRGSLHAILTICAGPPLARWKNASRAARACGLAPCSIHRP